LQNNTFSTLFVGQNLIKLSAVDSTNNFLKLMVSKSEPLPEGTVIMAENQFAGRGQQQNVWQAEPGKNLTFSVLLKPDFLPVPHQFLLNMAISIALNDALTEIVGDGVTIKWPNDIYYKDQKLGGVLIENILMGQTYKIGIIGIGLNVNQQIFHEQLAGRATSVFQILHKNVNLIKLLAVICSHIESQYLKLKVNKNFSLENDYLKRLYLYRRPAHYKHNGEVFEGTITGVTPQGLLVISEEGKERTFNFKEVEFLF
jgi:BirA family biotin operon repressor/biotin-[acetyl-CoA-carboxylase] ligase